MTESPDLRSDPVAPAERTLDTKTIEVLALAAFRAIFRQGVHVPLKAEGLMDMDLVVRDSNVLLNLNQVQMNVPELVLWRMTFSYRGKPVVEYGRGIKNGTKVHLPQLAFLLLAIWRNRRKTMRAKERDEMARDREMAAVSVQDQTEGTTGEAPV